MVELRLDGVQRRAVEEQFHARIVRQHDAVVDRHGDARHHVLAVGDLHDPLPGLHRASEKVGGIVEDRDAGARRPRHRLVEQVPGIVALGAAKFVFGLGGGEVALGLRVEEGRLAQLLPFGLGDGDGALGDDEVVAQRGRDGGVEHGAGGDGAVGLDRDALDRAVARRGDDEGPVRHDLEGRERRDVRRRERQHDEQGQTACRDDAGLAQAVQRGGRAPEARPGVSEAFGEALGDAAGILVPFVFARQQDRAERPSRAVDKRQGEELGEGVMLGMVAVGRALVAEIEPHGRRRLGRHAARHHAFDPLDEGCLAIHGRDAGDGGDCP